MVITFYGHSTFALEFGKTTIVTDPCDIGYPARPARAEVITESHQHFDHNAAQGIDCPLVLSTQGSWEVGGVKISNLPCWHDDAQGTKRGENLIFVFEGEGLRVAHLGDLGHADGAFGLKNIDVLLIPIGGFYTIDTDAALEVIRHVKPRLTIPMHFKTPCIDFPIATQERFATLTGAKKLAEPRLEVTPESLKELPGAVILPWRQN